MNQILEWIAQAERPSGGLAAWQNPDGSYHSSYKEVTGYLLPTLVKWGAGDLAIRCANWLLSVQNPDGSFSGLDGIPRPFDTSAVIEGLEAVYHATGTAIYRAAANEALAWMRTQIMPDGYLRNSSRNDAASVYNLRASYIIGNRREMDFWKQRGLFIQPQERSHYLAYALEGALNFGEFDFAMPYIHLAYESGNLLQPFYAARNWSPAGPDWDYCASCQMAILFHRVGLDATKHYDAVLHRVTQNGGLAQSQNDPRLLLWAAKFLLDLMAIMEGVTV